MILTVNIQILSTISHIHNTNSILTKKDWFIFLFYFKWSQKTILYFIFILFWFLVFFSCLWSPDNLGIVSSYLLKADFHSEGHMAILYHGHALGSKMDMPVAIIAPSCPWGPAHSRELLGCLCVHMSRWRIYEKAKGEQRMLALHILREEMTKERKKETGTKEREEKSVSQKNRDRVAPCIIYSYTFK